MSWETRHTLREKHPYRYNRNHSPHSKILDFAFNSTQLILALNRHCLSRFKVLLFW